MLNGRELICELLHFNAVYTLHSLYEQLIVTECYKITHNETKRIEMA